MRFTIDDKRLIKCIWVKKSYAEKRLLNMFLTEDKVLMEVKTLVQKYQCEIFNFVDLCSGVGIVWSTTTGTRVSDATAVTFSVKFLNPLKLYLLSGNIFKKVVFFILFIYSRVFRNNVISNGKSYCCIDTFTDIRFTSLLAKNI